MKSVLENEFNRFCFELTLWLPRQGQGQWKQYKMVKTNCAYKHGRYEKNWLKNLCQMSNVKVFVMQDSRLASQMNTAHYTDPYDSQLDKKNRNDQTTVSSKLHCHVSLTHGVRYTGGMVLRNFEWTEVNEDCTINSGLQLQLFSSSTSLAADNQWCPYFFLSRFCSLAVYHFNHSWSHAFFQLTFWLHQTKMTKNSSIMIPRCLCSALFS